VTAIAIRELAKHYGPIRAVDGASLTVAEGEIYALLGLNGAGKTTTIRVLLGMITPTSGSVSLFGQPVSHSTQDIWRQVGYLVETPAAYPELTVRQNLRLYARLKHVAPQAISEVIARLGLEPNAHRRARDLSLGNQQRLVREYEVGNRAEQRRGVHFGTSPGHFRRWSNLLSLTERCAQLWDAPMTPCFVSNTVGEHVPVSQHTPEGTVRDRQRQAM